MKLDVIRKQQIFVVRRVDDTNAVHGIAKIYHEGTWDLKSFLLN